MGIGILGLGFLLGCGPVSRAFLFGYRKYFRLNIGFKYGIFFGCGLRNLFVI